MKSLTRTNAVDFANISDEDYYSYGETSDDLTKDAKQANNENANNPFQQNASFDFSMQQHLFAIDSKVSDRSDIFPQFTYEDSDFYLDKLNHNYYSKILNRSKESPDLIGCIIINIAHAAQYHQIESEYSFNNHEYIAWSVIPFPTSSKLDQTRKNKSNDSTSSISDFPLVVHSFYKEAYNSYKRQIRFIHYASPSSDKLDTLINTRKEIPTSRILFHYVGYGYPDPQDGCIFTCEAKNMPLVQYKIKNIYNNIRSPCFFIFDCNKAGDLGSALLKEISKQSVAKNNDSEDVFLICSTNSSDSLPMDLRLPRDFLSSCLLSPVQMSILCHIIRSYTLTDSCGKDPFLFIKRNFSNFNNNNVDELVDLLHCITDAIASESLSEEVFTKVFRGDSMVSSLFYNFMLAQYLLYQYNVFPKSYPVMPDTIPLHPLWSEWESIIDVIITSTITPLPSFSNNFFWRVSTIFNSLLNSSNSYTVSRSLRLNNATMSQAVLTLICHAVFFNMNSKTPTGFKSLETTSTPTIQKPKRKHKTSLYQLEDEHILMAETFTEQIPKSNDEICCQALLQLAKFASKSEDCASNVSKSIQFNLLIKKLSKVANSNNLHNRQLMERFVEDLPKKLDEFHSLCFLAVCLINVNIDFVFDIKSDADFSCFPPILFNDGINQMTRTLVCAILASVVVKVNSVRYLCSNQEFLLNLKKSIPSFSSELLTWTLILLKKTFLTNSIEETLFAKDSVHIQIASCIFHNAFLCRAATVSSLSCFMQQNKSDNDNLKSFDKNKSPPSPFCFQMKASPSEMNNFSIQMKTPEINNFGIQIKTNFSPPTFHVNSFQQDSLINKTIFFLTFPTFVDMSYLVRYQYLVYIIHFLHASKPYFESLINAPPEAQQSSSLGSNLKPPTQLINLNNRLSEFQTKLISLMRIDISSFKSMISEWTCLMKNLSTQHQEIDLDQRKSLRYVDNLGSVSQTESITLNNDGSVLSFDFGITNFESYAKIVDCVCKREDTNIRMYALSLFMLHYFTRDPHPSIRAMAAKSRKYFSIDQIMAALPPINKNLQNKYIYMGLPKHSFTPQQVQIKAKPKDSAEKVKTNKPVASQSKKGNFFAHFTKSKSPPNPDQLQIATSDNLELNVKEQIQSSSLKTEPKIGEHSQPKKFIRSENSIDDLNKLSSSSSSGYHSEELKGHLKTEISKQTVKAETQFVNQNKDEDTVEQQSEMSLLYESESHSVFHVALRNLTRSVNLASENKEKSKCADNITRHLTAGKIDIPGINLSVRSESKYLYKLILNRQAQQFKSPIQQSKSGAIQSITPQRSNTIISSQPPKLQVVDCPLSPKLLTYCNENLRLAVTTKNRSVYIFNDKLQLERKIRNMESSISYVRFLNNLYCTDCNVNDLSESMVPKKSASEVSDVFVKEKGFSQKSNELHTTNNTRSLCLIASCDGCMKLWDMQNKEPCAAWRASSFFNDDSTPLYFTAADTNSNTEYASMQPNYMSKSNYQTHIVSGRGSSEICVWDLASQKLVCEYLNPGPIKEYNKEVSAMTIHPKDPNVVVIGYSNGLITSLDTRAPSNNSVAPSNVTLNITLSGEKIICFSTNRNGDDFLYAATSAGNAVVYSASNNMISTAYLSRKNGMTSFSGHQMLPLLSYSNKLDCPVIVSSYNKILSRLNNFSPGSLVLFHPIFPVITVASPASEIVTYDIGISFH